MRGTQYVQYRPGIFPTELFRVVPVSDDLPDYKSALFAVTHDEAAFGYLSGHGCFRWVENFLCIKDSIKTSDIYQDTLGIKKSAMHIIY